MAPRREELIFDIGLHTGEDTAFYLAKGFRVVAVEASPTLAAVAEKKFQESVDAGRLVVVNAAIAAEPGPVAFYANATTEWGTIRSDWADRNARLGSASTEVMTVEGAMFSSIVEKYGVPYYMKIDIEGADMLCLEGLTPPEVPKYVSIESDKVSWKSLEREFEVLTGLGYRRFKVVPQHRMGRQKPPNPPREGRYVDYAFHHMSSGMFGEEAPGRWMSANQAMLLYRYLFLRYRLYGDGGRFRDTTTGRLLWSVMRGPGWYDTHAAL